MARASSEVLRRRYARRFTGLTRHARALQAFGFSVFAPDLKLREQGDVFRLLIKVNTLRKPRSTSFRVCAADAGLTLGGLAYIAELAVAKAAGGRAC